LPYTLCPLSSALYPLPCTLFSSPSVLYPLPFTLCFLPPGLCPLFTAFWTQLSSLPLCVTPIYPPKRKYGVQSETENY
jgi:hypothetical protein